MSEPTLKAYSLPQLAASPLDSSPADQPASSPQLERYTAPATLAGLTLDGEISSQRARTLRYRSKDGQESLSLVISTMPDGWETMNPERAVASNYSEIRQRRVQEALRSSANALTIVSETLYDLEGQPAAQAQLRWVEANQPVQSQALLITLYLQNFIRISNASYQQTPLWLLQQAKRAMAEFKAAQHGDAASH